MSETFKFSIDGAEIEAKPGQTILQAATDAGIYIPTLCSMQGLESHGSCRVCTVLVNGTPQAACTQPAAPGIKVENDTEKLKKMRKTIIEMLFVEGNHFCMFCEKSGNCELQALGYRLGLMTITLPYFMKDRELDGSHPDVFIDRNRCVLCGRCVQASRDIDGKTIFQFVGRGIDKRVAVNAKKRLADTALDAADKAIDVCPVGAILRKGVGFSVPVGQRLYDTIPIGSDIESGKK